MRVTKTLSGEDINPLQFKKWLSALRSEEFSQGIGQLQNSQGYCCLGVACEVLLKYRRREDHSKYLRGNEPTDQPESPAWLKAISHDFMNRTKYDGEGYYFSDAFGTSSVSLIDLNDSHKFKFQEIADLLEMVYVHGVLENNEEKQNDYL